MDKYTIIKLNNINHLLINLCMCFHSYIIKFINSKINTIINIFIIITILIIKRRIIKSYLLQVEKKVLKNGFKTVFPCSV